MKIIVFVKRNLFAIVFLLFVIFLVVFSNSSLLATKKGLNLWANNVVPSLFPFLVAAQLLSHTNFIYYLSKLCNSYMKPFFNVPGIGAFPFIMGIISGYPVGAKIISSLYSNHDCTKNEAERMLCFCNNSGPLFILGTVGNGFYGSSIIGYILLFTHILASIIVGIIFGQFSKFKLKSTSDKQLHSNPNLENVNINNLGEVLGNSIINSIKTILVIGGFVTLFSVILSILGKTKLLAIIASPISKLLHINLNIVVGFISGIIEFTNGLSMISSVHLKNLSINVCVSAFILGFGGISVLLQTLSIISKSKLSIKPYILGKVLQGIIASFLTFMIFKIPFFNLDI